MEQGFAVRAKACLGLVRVVNSLMVGFAVLVGLAIVAGRGVSRIPPETLILAYTTGFSISAASMVLNDLADIEIDRINAPERPLVSGLISVKAAYACYALLVAVGLLASYPLGWEALLVAVLGWIVGSLYDLWGKRSGFPGNLMVAFSTSLPFPYAMAVLGEWKGYSLVFWAMVFLTVLGREVAKDIADVEGDRAAGARTLPIILGERRSAAIAAILYLAAVALSPTPLLLGGVDPIAYGVFVAVVDAILVYESVRIVRDQGRGTVLTHKRNVLVAMLLGLLGFMIGALAG